MSTPERPILLQITTRGLRSDCVSWLLWSASFDLCFETVISSDKLENILPAFPVVEELYIESITWKESGDSVSSASLKKLIIHANGRQSMIAHITTTTRNISIGSSSQ
ncbi:hypothetical protein DY000_02053757 [Brassica cretica]|uniref:FBD domain-containing protein n=1 Tax=Brassica cretica TaxID=69181 RepID=A0ABQ7AJ30_BRACR|nr:hypothetical protein DY000_02053757 [Brassica cretica]